MKKKRPETLAAFKKRMLRPELLGKAILTSACIASARDERTEHRVRELEEKVDRIAWAVHKRRPKK